MPQWTRLDLMTLDSIGAGWEGGECVCVCVCLSGVAGRVSCQPVSLSASGLIVQLTVKKTLHPNVLHPCLPVCVCLSEHSIVSKASVKSSCCGEGNIMGFSLQKSDAHQKQSLVDLLI